MGGRERRGHGDWLWGDGVQWALGVVSTWKMFNFYFWVAEIPASHCFISALLMQRVTMEHWLCVKEEVNAVCTSCEIPGQARLIYFMPHSVWSSSIPVSAPTWFDRNYNQKAKIIFKKRGNSRFDVVVCENVYIWFENFYWTAKLQGFILSFGLL